MATVELDKIDNQILKVWCRARAIHFYFTFKTSHSLSKNQVQYNHQPTKYNFPWSALL